MKILANLGEKGLKLKAFFSDSTFPYMVDIIDLNSISENFKNRIQKDLFKIY